MTIESKLGRESNRGYLLVYHVLISVMGCVYNLYTAVYLEL